MMNDEWKQIAIKRIERAIDDLRQSNCIVSKGSCPVCEYMEKHHDVIVIFRTTHNACSDFKNRQCPAWESCVVFIKLIDFRYTCTYLPKFYKIWRLKRLIKRLRK